MRLIIALLSVSFLIACESTCWQAQCYDATEFRFNLIDSAGNDLFFGDSALYAVKHLQIKDSLNNSYVIQSADYGSMKFVVALSEDYLSYQISLEDSTLDFFSVTYEWLEEECCGLTPWVKDVKFQRLRTDISEDYIGSTNIYLE